MDERTQLGMISVALAEMHTENILPSSDDKTGWLIQIFARLSPGGGPPSVAPEFCRSPVEDPWSPKTSLFPVFLVDEACVASVLLFPRDKFATKWTRNPSKEDLYRALEAGDLKTLGLDSEGRIRTFETSRLLDSLRDGESD